MSAEQLWVLTLVVGLVVVGVVALLLALIVRSARRIRDTLDQVWVAGPAIAGQTVHLDLLRRINLVLPDVLEAGQRIATAADRIQEHAHGCAGCPRCVTGWGAGGPAEPTGA